MSKRFRVESSQGVFEGFKIIVDTHTGVNYLYASSGYGGGLTPLLDVNGKPIITNTYPNHQP